MEVGAVGYENQNSNNEAWRKLCSESDAAQRFFNLLCTAYGSDPKLFADVIKEGFLPEDRAVGCEREYLQLSHAFETLIRPHIDRKLARKLHKRWLPPITTKPEAWRSAD